MKYYAPENAHFLLPFQFDPALLQADLEKCMRFKFLNHYVPDNYDGENYILPLRSIAGKMDSNLAIPNSTSLYQDTIALKQCPYFREVINRFKCDKEAIRLMNLAPGGEMKVHTDYNCGYEDGLFRVHVPIITNEQVRFSLNDEVLIMYAGEVWYTNVNLPHGVINGGSTNRVHMVLDCIRNEWSDKLFDSMGYDFSKEEIEETFSLETVVRMIEELEIQNTPAAKEQIADLKQKYQID